MSGRHVFSSNSVNYFNQIRVGDYLSSGKVNQDGFILILLRFNEV